MLVTIVIFFLKCKVQVYQIKTDLKNNQKIYNSLPLPMTENIIHCSEYTWMSNIPFSRMNDFELLGYKYKYVQWIEETRKEGK